MKIQEISADIKTSLKKKQMKILLQKNKMLKTVNIYSEVERNKP